MKYISLTQQKTTTVDDEDYEILSQYKWHYTYYGYAARRKNNKIIYMHREVMGAPKGVMIDHLNQSTLDNRKTNLRLCNKKLNAANSKIRSDNSSGYKGVHWDKPRDKWVAAIQHEGRMFNLGGFLTKKEAAKAYNKAASEYFGEFAGLNNVSD